MGALSLTPLVPVSDINRGLGANTIFPFLHFQQAIKSRCWIEYQGLGYPFLRNENSGTSPSCSSRTQAQSLLVENALVNWRWLSIRSTGCSYRGPRLSSPHLNSASQPPVTPIPCRPGLSSCVCWHQVYTWYTYVHVEEHLHTQEITHFRQHFSSGLRVHLHLPLQFLCYKFSDNFLPLLPSHCTRI